MIHINGVLELAKGGMACDNTLTVYSGSADDVALSPGVALLVRSIRGALHGALLIPPRANCASRWSHCTRPATPSS